MPSRTWRFLGVWACAVLFLPLSACGDDKSSDTGYDTPSPTTHPMGSSGTSTHPMGTGGAGSTTDPMGSGSMGTMDDGSMTGTAPMNTGTDTTGMGAMDPDTR